MVARKLDPHKLDVAALAAAGTGGVQGEIDAHTLERWRDMQTPPSDVALPPVRWAARGEQRQRSAEAQTWLQLHVAADAWATCQRCLQPFSTPIEIDRAFRFVPTEGEAEALDADSDDDVLAPAASFDLIGLIEDELVLTWPLVPRHEQCSQPGHDAGGEPTAEERPFASLATWRARTAKP